MDAPVDAVVDDPLQKLIIDTIPAQVWIAGPDGAMKFVNRRWLDYTGRSLEETVDWGWTKGDVIHPEDLAGLLETWQRVLAAGEPSEAESRVRRADGMYRWFLIRAVPRRDARGVIIEWYGTNTDIDDRKRAESLVRASERSFKLIIDTIPALAWSARPDGTADFFNRHYLEFVGLSLEQAKDWGWTAAVHPDDLDGLTATWRRLLASEKRGETEARLRRHDGEYRWFLFRVDPLRDVSGSIVKWYGANTDIEARRRSEAELKRAYDSIADAQRLSKTGSFVIDLVGDDHNWSDETYRTFEFEAGTKISLQRIRDTIHPEDLASFDLLISRGMSGENVTFAFRISTARGAIKYLRGVAHVVEPASGRRLFVGALQDVTESKVAEEALDRARSDLAHVARVTTASALTASIAHEVNQPLSGITINAGTCMQMLDAEPANVDGARETARRLLRDANRASAVIARLRALFSKRESAREPLDLNEVTREVVALSLNDLQRNRIVLQSEFADNLPVITGDRIQLQQVVMNLLRNASDAMIGVTDRTRQLMIKTERDVDNCARVTIRDVGVGLRGDGMEKLFDAFYTTKADGMGIGLSVSRSIIEKHQGRLWAEPNDGPGATFAFLIPPAAEIAATTLQAPGS